MSEEYDQKSFADLQHAISREQETIQASSCLDVHRSSCIVILDGIESFLLDWELSTKNNNPANSNGPVSETSFNLHIKRFLLNTVSIVVSTLGPGDSQLRHRFLNWLSLTSTTACRQILLDALPAVLPPRDDGSSEARSCTRQVVVGLQSLLTDPKTRHDPSSIIPVLECLSFIRSLEADRPFSGDGQPSEVVVGHTLFQVAVDALPTVVDVDLPTLVRLLLRNISSAEQARKALIACRMETRLCKGGAHNFACVQEVLGSIQNSMNGALLTETYINLLEEIIDEVEETLSSVFVEKEVNVDDSVVDVDADQDHLVILDVAVLAILRLDPEKRSQVETLLDSMLSRFIFNWDAFISLIRTSKARPDTSNRGAGEHLSKRTYVSSRCSTNNNSLETGFLSLVIFFLLAPLRVAWVGTKKCKRKLHGFMQQAIVELYHHSDKPRQREIVECLFHLSEKVAQCDPSSASATFSAIHNDTTLLLLNNFDPRHRLHPNERQEQSLQSVYKSIQTIVVEIARDDPSFLIPFKGTLLGHLTRRDSCSMEICHACTLLSLLLRPDRGAEDQGAPCVEESEFLTVIWRLLFAPDENDRAIDQSDKGRVARGMVFATALVRSRKCCHETKRSLFEWVSRIVLPLTHRMPDSETGLHALQFLLVLQEECKRESHNDYVEQPVSLGKEIFQTIRMILGNMGLVRVLSQYEGKRGILGYTSRPKWLVSTETRPPKVRSMVFCFDAFTRHDKMLHPCEWDATNHWIFDLLNSYLRLGRERFQSQSSLDSTTLREKWTPHGWVEAAIEFPVVLLSKIKVTNKQQHIILEWLQTQTTDFEFLQKNLQRYETISDSDIWELIAEHHKDSDFNVFLQSLFRFSLSLITGIGVSAAVLQNSFEHFRKMRLQHAQEDFSELQQAEVSHLLYYQLMKMYNMQQKCLSVKRIFLALKMGSRRQYGRATSKSRKRRISQEIPRKNEPVDENLEHSKISKDVEVAIDQIDRNLSGQNAISSEILWAFVVDPVHDRKILDVIDGRKIDLASNIGNFLESGLVALIDIKKESLGTLIDRVGRWSSEEKPDDSFSLSSLVRCLRMASSLSLALPRVRSYKSVRRNSQKQLDTFLVKLVQLTSNYFRLLFMVLVHCCESSSTPTSRQLQLDLNNVDRLTFPDFCYLYETYLGVEGPIEEDLDRKGGLLPPPNMECVISSFLSHLRVCDDAVLANQLLETLSVLGEFGEDGCFLSKVSEINWAAMHTNFPNQGEGAGSSTPHVFLEVLRRSIPSSFLASRQATPKEMALTSTIVKTARNNSQGTQKNSLLVNGMLRHWGLLFFSSPLEHHLHLSLLCDHLDNFLYDISELFAAKQREESNDDTSDEEYLPPEAKCTFNRSEHTSSMPGLNGESFPVYFEVLMHMVVASVSVAHPACNSPRGPFHHLECLVEIFGSMSRLFSEKIDIFPRQTASIVCNASKAMLSVSIYQLHQCVEWRNAQPVPSMPEWESGAEDPASFRYLHRLLQSLGVHMISPLKCICDGANIGNRESFSYLLSAVKKALQAMEDVATSHNLKASRLGVQSAEEMNQCPRKRRCADVVAGLHQFGCTKPNQSPHRRATFQVTKQKHSSLGDVGVVQREYPTLNATSAMQNDTAETGTDDTVDDGISFDDDMSHSSASFGASGDWPGLHSGDDHAVSSESLLHVRLLKQK